MLAKEEAPAPEDIGALHHAGLCKGKASTAYDFGRRLVAQVFDHASKLRGQPQTAEMELAFAETEAAGVPVPDVPLAARHVHRGPGLPSWATRSSQGEQSQHFPVDVVEEAEADGMSHEDARCRRRACRVCSWTRGETRKTGTYCTGCGIHVHVGHCWRIAHTVAHPVRVPHPQ